MNGHTFYSLTKEFNASLNIQRKHYPTGYLEKTLSLHNFDRSRELGSSISQFQTENMFSVLSHQQICGFVILKARYGKGERNDSISFSALSALINIGTLSIPVAM